MPIALRTYDYDDEVPLFRQTLFILLYIFGMMAHFYLSKLLNFKMRKRERVKTIKWKNECFYTRANTWCWDGVAKKNASVWCMFARKLMLNPQSLSFFFKCQQKRWLVQFLTALFYFRDSLYRARDSNFHFTPATE